MPMSSIDSSQPSAEGASSQSFEMAGAAKLMDSTSNPSRAFSSMQMMTAAQWRQVMVCWSSEAGVADMCFP